jgi:cytochrome c oxidase assembly protein CtaG/Cox11
MWLFLILVFVLGGQRSLSAAESVVNFQDPTQVLGVYVRATYARDFVEAYRYISSADHKVRDLNRYVQQRGSFAGFSLDVAKRLSESIEIKFSERTNTPTRIQAAIQYKVPDPKKLSPLLLNWDSFRLNSLPPQERKRIIEAIEKKRSDGSLDMSEGEEKIELVRENEEWRIFLNWAAGVKIPLRLDLSKSADLDVSLSKNEIITQPGELFEIVLTVRNRTNQSVTARIGHLVEPDNVADYLDFVQCGFLLPVTIAPDKEEQFSGTYLLRGSLPEGVRQLGLTYDFRLLK